VPKISYFWQFWHMPKITRAADWCCQNLSKRALNALTVQASTIELGKLFQIFTMRAEKNAFVSHNETNDFVTYSGCLWCWLFR